MRTAQHVHVESSAEPLPAIRRVLSGADEVLAGVAFVRQSGVNPLAPQLGSLTNSRLITTTVFGSTTSDGLAAAREHGVGVRVLNPTGGTFHPKLYLGRHGDRIAAAVGSANLTSGLVANVEALALLDGPADAPALRELWKMAESWWAHPDAVDWSPALVTAPKEVLQPALQAMIEATIAVDRSVLTLGANPQRNVVREVTADGVWVETAASRAKGRPPQLVPAWMIQVAWDEAAGARLPHERLPARRRRPQRQALELRVRAAGAPAGRRGRASATHRAPHHRRRARTVFDVSSGSDAPGAQRLAHSARECTAIAN